MVTNPAGFELCNSSNEMQPVAFINIGVRVSLYVYQTYTRFDIYQGGNVTTIPDQTYTRSDGMSTSLVI